MKQVNWRRRSHSRRQHGPLHQVTKGDVIDAFALAFAAGILTRELGSFPEDGDCANREEIPMEMVESWWVYCYGEGSPAPVIYLPKSRIRVSRQNMVTSTPNAAGSNLPGDKLSTVTKE